MSSWPLLNSILDHDASTSRYPCLFDVLDNWSLHKLVTTVNPQPPKVPQTVGMAMSQTSSWPKLPVIWSQPNSNELLQSALNTEISFLNPNGQQLQFPPPPPIPQSPLSPPLSPHKGIIRSPRRNRASSAPPALQKQRVINSGHGYRRSVATKELRQGFPRAESHPDVPKSDPGTSDLFVSSSSFGAQGCTDMQASGSQMDSGNRRKGEQTTSTSNALESRTSVVSRALVRSPCTWMELLSAGRQIVIGLEVRRVRVIFVKCSELLKMRSIGCLDFLSSTLTGSF
jgi:hypothetical protein